MKKLADKQIVKKGPQKTNISQNFRKPNPKLAESVKHESINALSAREVAL